LVYDLNTDKWIILESRLNHAWADGIVFNDDHHIYVAGGISDHWINSIEKYSLSSNEWVVVNITMNQRLDGLTAIRTQYDSSGFIIFGGKSANWTYNHDIQYLYDLGTDKPNLQLMNSIDIDEDVVINRE